MAKCPAPKVGLLLNSIEAFNPQAKNNCEAAVRKYFADMVTSGTIHPDSIILGRIFGPHEAVAAANEFAAACVDLVVVYNVAFPNGHVFLTLATHPNLARTPMAVIADREPDCGEWALNSWCGLIMNNHVASQIGREIVAIPGPVDDTTFRTKFECLLRVAGTIKALRSQFICRFGDAPSGFHSATGDQLAYAATFGTKLDTVDLSLVLDVFNTGKAVGYLGERSFTEEDVRETARTIASERPINVPDEMLTKGVRLYYALKAILQANGYDSAAVRCWPELGNKYFGVSACMSLGLLMGNGDCAAVACESDWPNAVVQMMGAALTGKPAACLDWVNYIGGSDIVQLGHCGVGIRGLMAGAGTCGCCDSIDYNPVDRQAGFVAGPAHVGQFEYGWKTGICITQTPGGKMKLLAFRGESSESTDKGMTYAATDVRVSDPVKIGRLILQHGFPHHLAVAMGDIHDDLRMLCGYLGVEFITPED